MLSLVSCLLLLSSSLIQAQSKNQAIQGTKCARNQVVNKLVVYEDGAIEAECGPIPCGSSGDRCIDEQSACKAETDIFSGMKWAKNGQSLLLRCCSVSVPNKIYVGTDLVTLGSYYTGGLVAKKDMYGKDGPEYDFVVNVRTEQGGVRVWVYRLMCPLADSVEQKQVTQQNAAPAQQQQQSPATKPQSFEEHRHNILKQIAENRDAPAESVSVKAEKAALEEPANDNDGVINPLQYRPPQRQRDATRLL